MTEQKRKKRIRQDVINRDGQVCCYCCQELKLEEITMEHIVPESKRGTFNLTNLTVSCTGCNNRRGDRPFFEYAKGFFSEEKMARYRRIYLNNLKIKILNIAKEECLKDSAVPNEIIEKACKIMRIKPISFEENWLNCIEIKFTELVERQKIKFNFENLIKIIEQDS